MLASQLKHYFTEGRSLPRCWESSLCGWVSWRGCQCCCPMRVWQKWLTAFPSPVASQSLHRPSTLSSLACSVLRSSHQSTDSNAVTSCSKSSLEKQLTMSVFFYLRHVFFSHAKLIMAQQKRPHLFPDLMLHTAIINQPQKLQLLVVLRGINEI